MCGLIALSSGVATGAQQPASVDLMVIQAYSALAGGFQVNHGQTDLPRPLGELMIRAAPGTLVPAPWLLCALHTQVALQDERHDDGLEAGDEQWLAVGWDASARPEHSSVGVRRPPPRASAGYTAAAPEKKTQCAAPRPRGEDLLASAHAIASDTTISGSGHTCGAGRVGAGRWAVASRQLGRQN